jgi:hypothetical protein
VVSPIGTHAGKPYIAQHAHRHIDLARLQGTGEGSKCEYVNMPSLSSACKLTPLSTSRRLERLATVSGGQCRYQQICC